MLAVEISGDARPRLNGGVVEVEADEIVSVHENNNSLNDKVRTFLESHNQISYLSKGETGDKM